jgi:RHS repeat-associated protein
VDQLAAVTSNYDTVGNRTASLGVSSYITNASNELTASSNATYTYDSNGTTLTKTVGSNTTTYAWDYENRLTSVTLPGTGGTVTFKYDPYGRRIEKTTSSATSIYAYDGDNLIEEANSSGAVVARYTQTQNIDEPLAMLRSSTTSYFNADGLGSVTSLSNAAGSLAQTYTFDSFGKQTASSGSLTNPFEYTAREFDTETNLYYNRARYLDQSIGRFISEDPIRFRGGFDFYAYADDSPTNLTDPSGLCPPGTPGCAPPNPHNAKPRSTCSLYPDVEHWLACKELAGDDPIGQCVRGCLQDQYDTGTHKYKCDESNLHCSCFDACGYKGDTFLSRRARKHFNCDQPTGPKGPPA